MTQIKDYIDALVDKHMEEVKEAFMQGYYFGISNQIDEDSAWEAYLEEQE